MMTTIARASFTFPEFTGRSQLALRGSAAFWNGVLRLTPASPETVGAAWYREPVPVAGGFTTELRFILSGQGGDRDEIGATGGDGFAFVVRGLSSAAIGGKGAGLGYHGITHSLAVEFDSYLNLSPGDSHNTADVNADGTTPPGDHVSVNTRGTAPNSAFHASASVGCTRRLLKLASTDGGAPHVARITYLPRTAESKPRIRVFLDDSPAPALEVPLPEPLETLLGLGDDATAWVGFTASTGTAWEAHDIVSWSFAARSSIR